MCRKPRPARIPEERVTIQALAERVAQTLRYPIKDVLGEVTKVKCGCGCGELIGAPESEIVLMRNGHAMLVRKECSACMVARGIGVSRPDRFSLFWKHYFGDMVVHQGARRSCGDSGGEPLKGNSQVPNTPDPDSEDQKKPRRSDPCRRPAARHVPYSIGVGKRLLT